MKPILTVITLCLTLFSSLIALDANAADWGRRNGPGWRGPRGPIGPPPPPPGYDRPRPGPGYGAGYGGGYTPPNVSCSASDNGWEEHFFGHSTCDDCKRKHGKCTERCSQTSYNCRAEGTGWVSARNLWKPIPALNTRPAMKL